MSAKSIEVNCPFCHQRNLLLKQSLKGTYKCDRCQSQLSNPLMKSTSQTPVALQGREVIGFSVLVSIGLHGCFGRSVLAGSQPLPISSIPVPSQLKTIPNPPSAIALNRSLPENTVLVSPATSGGGSLDVSNGTDRDAYIKLVEPRSGELVAAFYVKSNSNFTLEQIPDGAYQVLFVLGTDWDAKTSSFIKNKRFAKFDKYLNFTTTQTSDEIQYRAFTITLNPVVGGNARTSGVNEQEFERY